MAKEKEEKINRDTIKNRIKKKVRGGYLIGVGVMILGILIMGVTGFGMILFVLGIVEMIVWKFINPIFWPKFAGDTTSCYECNTEIDLAYRWECGDCKDITRRHAASKCPSCGVIMGAIPCPSCETTLTVHPKFGPANV